MSTKSTVDSWDMQLLLFLFHILPSKPRGFRARLRNERSRILALLKPRLDLVGLASTAMRLVALLLGGTHAAARMNAYCTVREYKALIARKIVLEGARSRFYEPSTRSGSLNSLRYFTRL